MRANVWSHTSCGALRRRHVLRMNRRFLTHWDKKLETQTRTSHDHRVSREDREVGSILPLVTTVTQHGEEASTGRWWVHLQSLCRELVRGKEKALVRKHQLHLISFPIAAIPSETLAKLSYVGDAGSRTLALVLARLGAMAGAACVAGVAVVLGMVVMGVLG